VRKTNISVSIRVRRPLSLLAVFSVFASAQHATGQLSIHYPNVGQTAAHGKAQILEVTPRQYQTAQCLHVLEYGVGLSFRPDLKTSLLERMNCGSASSRCNMLAPWTSAHTTRARRAGSP
jgi:hypothetical protein